MLDGTPIERANKTLKRAYRRKLLGRKLVVMSMVDVRRETKEENLSIFNKAMSTGIL